MRIWFACVLLLAGRALPAAEDTRQLVSLPTAAEVNLRAEMRTSLLALNEILTLVAAGKYQEAAAVAEKDLGVAAMGKHRSQPLAARPGPHMPPAMHAVGIEGHQAASEFARIAASGDGGRTIAALPLLTAACVACHHSYRLR